MTSEVELEIKEIPRNKVTTVQGKGRKWSNAETDQLIDLLEKHFCLWYISKKEYHLQNVREGAYKQMRDELGINIADIKAKIMNLHSQLGREVSKTKSKKSGQSVSENYKSTWMYWDRLQFLMPVMQAGKSKDSLRSRSSTPESLDIYNCLDNSISISVNEEYKIPSLPSPGKGKSHKRSADFKSKARNELLSTRVKVLKEPLPEPQAKQQFPFSLYIAEKLSGFDKRSRMIAEKRINDVIFEIEMGAINNERQTHWQDIPPQGYMNMLQNQQIYR